MNLPLALAILGSLGFLGLIVLSAWILTRIPPKNNNAASAVSMGSIVVFIVLGWFLAELWRWAV